MVYPQIKYLALLLALNFAIHCAHGFHFTSKREQKGKPGLEPESQNKAQNSNTKVLTKGPADKSPSSSQTAQSQPPSPPKNDLCNGEGKFPHEDNRRYIYCFTSIDVMIYQVTDCPLGLCFNPTASCCDAESCSGDGGNVKPEPPKSNPAQPPKGNTPQTPKGAPPQPQTPKGNTPQAPKGTSSQPPNPPQPQSPDAKNKFPKENPKQKEDIGKPPSKDNGSSKPVPNKNDNAGHVSGRKHSMEYDHKDDGFSITSLEMKYYFNSKKKVKSMCQSPIKCTSNRSKANAQDHNSYYVCLAGRAPNSFVARLVKCKKESCFRRGKCGRC